jgi:hypothetical protein
MTSSADSLGFILPHQWGSGWGINAHGQRAQVLYFLWRCWIRTLVADQTSQIAKSFGLTQERTGGQAPKLRELVSRSERGGASQFALSTKRWCDKS